MLPLSRESASSWFIVLHSQAISSAMVNPSRLADNGKPSTSADSTTGNSSSPISASAWAWA